MVALRRALQLAPESPDGWRLLADQLDVTGNPGGADQARARYLKAATRDPKLIEAAAAGGEQAAMRMRGCARTFRATDRRRRAAHVGGMPAQLRRYQDAQQLLDGASARAGFDMAHYNTPRCGCGGQRNACAQPDPAAARA